MCNRFGMVSMDTDVEELLALSQNNLALIQTPFLVNYHTF